MIALRLFIASVANTSLRATAIIAVTSMILSCSGNNSTSFLSMDRATESPSLRPVSGSHGLYELNSAEGQIFAASLKECQLADKTSPASLTRQLFVGLDNLHIFTQDREKQNQIISEAAASLDGSPILLLAISTKRDNCIFDTIFWRPIKSKEDRFGPETVIALTSLSNSVLSSSGELE